MELSRVIRAFAFSCITLLAACGGDDGDTIVKGSKDDQARADIETLKSDVATVESDLSDLDNQLGVLDGDSAAQDIDSLQTEVSNLSTTVSGINSDLSALELQVQTLASSQAPVFVDNSDTVLGRFLYALHYAGAWVVGISSTGYLIPIEGNSFKFYGTLRFTGAQCSGQAYLQLPNDSPITLTFIDTQGIAFKGGNSQGSITYYVPQGTSTAFNVSVASGWNQLSGCTDSITTIDGKQAFPNDSATTSVPDQVQNPIRLQ